MADHRCVFALPQVAEDFACQYGELVTRRAGPDISCQSATTGQLCSQLHEQLKNSGLAAFDYDDDLTQVPHSIWAKIQYGGLLGLQNLLGIQSDHGNVENIAALIEHAQAQFQQLEQLPYPELVPAMQNYRMKRRRKR